MTKDDLVELFIIAIYILIAPLLLMIALKFWMIMAHALGL